MTENTSFMYNSSLIISIIILVISPSLAYKHLDNNIEHCLTPDSPKDEAKFCYYHYDENALRERKADYPIHPMILGRVSYYEQTGDSLSDKELFPLFEAMRWGASSFNCQPWRVIYAHRGTSKYQDIFKLLVLGNQMWNGNSSVLALVVTDMWTKYQDKDYFQFSQSFSTGIGIGQLQFEGTARGYLVHIMTGMEKDLIAKYLGIEANRRFRIEMIISIGKREPANKRIKTKKKDIISPRKKLSNIISLDVFKNEWRY